MMSSTVSAKGNNDSIGSFQFNDQTARQRSSGEYPFWNPSDDFKGLVECFGEIRHVAKTGKMKSDLDVIDVIIIDGTETRKTAEVRTAANGSREEATRQETKKYTGTKFGMVLSKVVLKSKFEALKPLKGRRIGIVGLGRKTDKKYLDYYVAVEEQARKEGVIS